MKRLTETSKWRDPWFRRLSPVAKLLWCYLCDNCNQVGIIELDVDGASFDIGAKVNQSHIDELSSRVSNHNNKLLIKKFITFQCGKLSPVCPAHKPVLAAIEKYGLIQSEEGYEYPNGSLPIGYVGAPEKASRPATRFVKPTREELDLHAAKIELPKSEVDAFVNFYESNGWKVGKNKMESWPAAMSGWKGRWEERRKSSKPDPADRNAGTANAAPSLQNQYDNVGKVKC